MSLEFPRVASIRPSAKPARDAVDYPDSWVESLMMSAPHPDRPIMLAVRLRNYNKSLGLLSHRRDGFNLDVQDLKAEATRVPALAQAMGTVLTVVNMMASERGLVGQIQQKARDRVKLEQNLVTNNQQLADAQAALATAQADLDAANALDPSDPTKDQAVADAQLAVTAITTAVSDLQAIIVANEAAITTVDQEVVTIEGELATLRAQMGIVTE